MKKLNVAVIFGSKSVEHDISVITAHQIMEALDKSKYNVFPIYIAKTGKWLYKRKFLKLEPFKNLLSPIFWFGLRSVQLNEHFAVLKRILGIWNKRIRIDVAIPALHGTFGEDGTVPAYLELLGVPYVGSGILSSAICMHKGISKRVMREASLPIIDFIQIEKTDYRSASKHILDEIEKCVGYPLFVKPASLGSSIGVSKVSNREELEDALDLAFVYDSEAIAEHAVLEPLELNCSVIGNRELKVSTIERPIALNDSFLNFEAKYLQGSKKLAGMQNMAREVPAKIPDDVSSRIRELACKAYRVCNCSGIARVDFLMSHQSGEVYINEINTLPGSFAYYLWEHDGISFTQLLDQLISMAFEKHRQKTAIKFTLEENLLAKNLSLSKVSKKDV